uniref:rRNA biogenesis protein RRP36 n=1 Tax=Ciona savignyi TaxID=51511 RepID=H2YGQ7_CIOSA
SGGGTPVWSKFSDDKNSSLQDMMRFCEKIGSKKVKKEILISKSDKTSDQTFKRKNKNRPQEMSSKVKVPKIRQVVNVSKPTSSSRDPRFDDLCGSEYQEELFHARYHFLDGVRRREEEQLRRRLRRSKSGSEEQWELKYLLTRMKQQESAKEKRRKKREDERKWKKEERAKVLRGVKKPYFLKNSMKKKLSDESGPLSGSNKVEVNREKKKKSKESKVMPYTRR